MFIGIGTLVNVTTVVVGSLLGLLVGRRITDRYSSLIIDVLALITIFLGFTQAMQLAQPALNKTAGSGMLIVLGALLLGALSGTWLRLEDRLDTLGERLQNRFQHTGRFAEAFVTSSLLFCVGPMTILGSLSDGLGRGPEQLFVKSTMDGFASIIFASGLGIGVLFSAIVVALVQGTLTLLGYFGGDVLSAAQIDALSATGGIMLIGLGVRLLGLKEIRVADLLPALVIAPVLVWLASLLIA